MSQFTKNLRKKLAAVAFLFMFLFFLYSRQLYKKTKSIDESLQTSHVRSTDKTQENIFDYPQSTNMNSKLDRDKNNINHLYLERKYVIPKLRDVVSLSAKLENITNDTCQITVNKNNSTVGVNEKVYCIREVERNLRDSLVKPGGLYSPKNCKARYRVAIIVPYRNRAHMLAVFLNHMHPFLIKQDLDYGIYLVEPAHDLKFNRGLLLNIGFLESLKLSNNHWSCFIFHDVDLLPEDERNYYSCPPEFKPRHMSSLVSTLDYKLPYNEIFGGVSAMTREQVVKVNGYSNLYFGWGGEDDDLRTRIVNSCLMVSRYPLEIGRYLMVNHEKDKNPNPHRYIFLNDVFKNMKHDGLNSIQYNVTKVRQKKLFTHIFVSYNETKIVQEKYNYLKNQTNLESVEEKLPF